VNAICDPTLDIYLGDNLPVIAGFRDASFNLVYIDPPLNTGKSQARAQLRTVRDASGDRIPYLAPGLVTPEKAARGKTPTDVW